VPIALKTVMSPDLTSMPRSVLASNHGVWLKYQVADA